MSDAWVNKFLESKPKQGGLRGAVRSASSRIRKILGIEADSAGLMGSELLWGIDERAYAEMESRLGGLDMAAERERYEAYLASPEAAESKPYEMDGNVAVIPVCGVITKESSFWSWLFGGTGMDQIQAAIQRADEDSEVERKRLVFDTPGGMVSGAQETARILRESRNVKPIDGQIRGCCCSAGYWFAAQCSSLVATEDTALIGNVGVTTKFDDLSKMFAAMGIERIVFGSAPLKGAGTPGTSLSKEQKAEIQGIVDGCCDVFVEDIALGRGISVKKAREWATAHTYLSTEALAAGLIDSIDGANVKPLDSVAVVVDSDEDDPEGSSALDNRHETFRNPRGGDDTLSGQGISGAGLTDGSGARAAIQTTAAQRLPASHTGLRPEEKGRKMKSVLARILSAFGHRSLALDVTAATDESEENLARVLAEGIDKQVKEHIEKHPLVMACEVSGIKTAEDFKRQVEMAGIGIAEYAKAKQEAKVESVRLYGATDGPAIGANVDNCTSFEQVKRMRDGWRTEADKKFGIGRDGESATRVSVPAANAEALIATNSQRTAEGKTAWEKLGSLSESAQAHAVRIGMDTPEKQEKYAKQWLADMNIKEEAPATV